MLRTRISLGLLLGSRLLCVYTLQWDDAALPERNEPAVLMQRATEHTTPLDKFTEPRAEEQFG